MATYTIDWEECLEAALSMDDDLPLGTDIEPRLSDYYSEADGKLVLDRTRRDALVAEIKRHRDHEKLESENRRLKDERDRAVVTKEVRRAMVAANFRPEFLDAAIAHFMSQHRFAIRDGKVLVVGRAGPGDALSAAVQWADSGEVDALLTQSRDADGDFKRAVDRLRSTL